MASESIRRRGVVETGAIFRQPLAETRGLKVAGSTQILPKLEQFGRGVAAWSRSAKRSSARTSRCARKKRTSRGTSASPRIRPRAPRVSTHPGGEIRAQRLPRRFTRERIGLLLGSREAFVRRGPGPRAVALAAVTWQQPGECMPLRRRHPIRLWIRRQMPAQFAQRHRLTGQPCARAAVFIAPMFRFGDRLAVEFENERGMSSCEDRRPGFDGRRHRYSRARKGSSGRACLRRRAWRSSSPCACDRATIPAAAWQLSHETDSVGATVGGRCACARAWKGEWQIVQRASAARGRPSVRCGSLSASAMRRSGR